jgi:hypothetical protein
MGFFLEWTRKGVASTLQPSARAKRAIRQQLRKLEDKKISLSTARRMAGMGEAPPKRVRFVDSNLTDQDDRVWVTPGEISERELQSLQRQELKDSAGMPKSNAIARAARELGVS